MPKNRGLIILSAVICAAAVITSGCESTVSDNIPTKTHGSSAGDGYTYGTGPNKTKPYPQSSPVKIEGVPGAKPKYEPLSKGGNNNYTVLGQNYMVWKNCNSYLEIGTASWYGPGFHGNKTSNGEVYNQKGFTAAHKNLPLPSYVKVTNLENGRTVIVRVNDRGPFHGSRIIDLSEGAAKAINMTGKGTAKVKLELISVRGSSNVGEGDGRYEAFGQAVAGAVIGGLLDKVAEESGLKRNINNADNISSLVSEIESGSVSAQTVKNAAVSAADLAGQINTAVQSTDSTGSAATNSAAGSLTQEKGYMGNPQAAEVTYSEFAMSVTPTATNSSNNADAGFLLPGKAYIQVFSTVYADKAERVRQSLQGKTVYGTKTVVQDGLNKVMLGPVGEQDLSVMLEYMKQAGYRDAFIKRMD